LLVSRKALNVFVTEDIPVVAEAGLLIGIVEALERSSV
jgi:hypothetical protein